MFGGLCPFTTSPSFPTLPQLYAPMPLLKASIKHARQSDERRLRRQPYKTSMKTSIRKVQELVKAGNKAEAQKVLPKAFKDIDMAAKRKIVHWKNAARKKSLLSRLVSTKA